MPEGRARTREERFVQGAGYRIVDMARKTEHGWIVKVVGPTPAQTVNLGIKETKGRLCLVDPSLVGNLKKPSFA